MPNAGSPHSSRSETISSFSVRKEELVEQGVTNSSASESPSLDEDVQLQISPRKPPKQNKIKQNLLLDPPHIFTSGAASTEL